MKCCYCPRGTQQKHCTVYSCGPRARHFIWLHKQLMSLRENFRKLDEHPRGMLDHPAASFRTYSSHTSGENIQRLCRESTAHLKERVLVWKGKQRENKRAVLCVCTCLRECIPVGSATPIYFDKDWTDTAYQNVCLMWWTCWYSPGAQTTRQTGLAMITQTICMKIHMT